MRRRAVGVVAAATATALLAVGAAVPASAATSLRALAEEQGIDIGFALDPNLLNEPAYKEIVDSESNLVVAGNAMKWDATEPQQGVFTFADGDRVADYAESTGKKLYGHTLAWHSQVPGWLDQLDGPALLDAMRNHVAGVAGHYRGQVDSWDVVNEAFEDDGSRRQSMLQTKIGDRWVEEAFIAARAADPDAKLCINDYSTDAVNAKSTAIYDLVRDFQARDIPIDCVGFQAHLILGQVPSTMQQNLQRFVDLGLEVRVTELDIRMQTPPDATKLAQQARDFAEVFEICLAVDGCQGVTIWGVTDRDSWIPDVFAGEGAAVVWDENFEPKPAYAAIVEALGGSTDPDPTPDPDPDPTPDPEPGDCAATLTIVNNWGSGYQANVTIAAGSSALTGWSTALTLPSSSSVDALWGGTVSGSGATLTVVNAPWNGAVGSGQSTSFGFVGSGPAPAAGALTCTAG